MMPSSGRSLDKAFAIIGAISAIVAAAALVALIFVARQADIHERTYEGAVVQRGVRFRVNELENELRPHVIWDEALTNVDSAFDGEWITKNIGLPIIYGYGYKSLFILSGEGKPIYALEGRQRINPEEYQTFDSTAKPLIVRLRHEETRWRLKKEVPPPLHASIARQIGLDRFLLTVSIIQGDFEGKPEGEHAPILITILPLEVAFAKVLGTRYALEAPKIVNRRSPDKAHAAIPTDPRSLPLFLEWLPRTPGSTLLRFTSWPIAVLLITLAVIFAALVHASRKVVAQLTTMAAEARWRALHDPLTGLGNRAYLSNILQSAVEDVALGRPFAVLIIDLDHFKAINDNWGHEAGDEMIVKAGEMLKLAAGTEAKVARLGGDEFVIVLFDADLNSTKHVCTRILERNGNASISTGEVVQISCTIGAALISDVCFDSAKALRSADRALYQAKVAGRGKATIKCFQAGGEAEETHEVVDRGRTSAATSLS